MSHNYFKINPKFLRKDERDYLMSILQGVTTSHDDVSYIKHLRENCFSVKYIYKRFKNAWGCIGILKNNRRLKIRCFSSHVNKKEAKELTAKMIWSEIMRKSTSSFQEVSVTENPPDTTKNSVYGNLKKVYEFYSDWISNATSNKLEEDLKTPENPGQMISFDSSDNYYQIVCNHPALEIIPSKKGIDYENVNREEKYNEKRFCWITGQKASFHKNSDTLEIIPFDNKSIEYENVNTGDNPKSSPENRDLKDFIKQVRFNILTGKMEYFNKNSEIIPIDNEKNIDNVNTEENHIETEDDLKTPENPGQMISFDNENIDYETVNTGIESPKKSFEEQFNELVKKEEEKIKEAYTLFNKLQEVYKNITEDHKSDSESECTDYELVCNEKHPDLDKPLVSPQEDDESDESTKTDEEWNKLSNGEKKEILDKELSEISTKSVSLKRTWSEIQ